METGLSSGRDGGRKRRAAAPTRHWRTEAGPRLRRVEDWHGRASGVASGADRAGWALLILFSAVVNGLMLTGPVFMLQIYDRVLAAGSGATLAVLFALVCGLYAGMAALDVARLHLAVDLGARLQARLEARLVARPGVTRPVDAGVDEIEALRRAVAAPGLLALFDLVWTPLFLAVLFALHPWLGSAGLAGGAVLGAAALWHYRGVRATARAAAQAAEMAAQSRALAGASGPAPAVWMRHRATVHAATRTAGRQGALHLGLSRSFRLFLQSALLALGAWLVLRGEATPGVMVAATILAGRALAPVEPAAAHWPLLAEARRARARLAAAGVMDARSLQPDASHGSAGVTPGQASRQPDTREPDGRETGTGRAAALRLVPAASGAVAPARRRGVATAEGAAPLVRIWPASLAGVLALALLMAGALGWAVAMPVSGVVVLPGRVQAGAGSLGLQPPAGALRVAEVLVADGARVAAGAPLVRFEDPEARAELAQILAQLDAARARAARHAADLAGLLRAGAEDAGPDIVPGSILNREDLGRIARAASRALERVAAVGLAAARLAHGRQEAALARQRAALEQQAALVEAELATQERLLDQGLAQAGRSLALRREAARLEGVMAEIDAQAARSAQALTDAEAAVARWRAERQIIAAEGLATAQAQVAVLAARLPALEARAGALVLRAPEAGVVDAVEARPGAQVVPGAVALWLVPDAPLRIVAHLPARQGGLIETGGGGGGAVAVPAATPRLHPGGSLRLRLPPESAASGAEEVAGRILSVAAEARVPDGAGPGAAPYFRVVIMPEPAATARLRPGLPVEVLVPTPARPALERLRAALGAGRGP